MHEATCVRFSTQINSFHKVFNNTKSSPIGVVGSHKVTGVPIQKFI